MKWCVTADPGDTTLNKLVPSLSLMLVTLALHGCGFLDDGYDAPTIPSSLPPADEVVPDAPDDGPAFPPPIYAEHLDLTYFLDKDGVEHAIGSVAQWATRRQHVMAHVESVMGALPGSAPRTPPRYEVVEVEEIGNLTRRKIRYWSDDMPFPVDAYILLPNTGGKPVPAVLCLHQTTTYAKREPAGVLGQSSLAYGLHLAERGYVTMMPDYPSFGESEFELDPRWPYSSTSMKAIWDNMRAIDLLQSLPEVDSARIGCLGHSLGAHNGMFTAVFDERIRVVVANAGFAQFSYCPDGDVSHWGSDLYMPLIRTKYDSSADLVPFDFSEIVAALAPRPFLTIMPAMDRYFPMAGTVAAVEAARPIYTLRGVPDNLQAEYPDIRHSFPPPSRDRAYEFLDRYLWGREPVAEDAVPPLS